MEPIGAHRVNGQLISPGAAPWRELFLPPLLVLEERRKELQSQLEKTFPTSSLLLKKCKGDELGKLVDVKLYPSE